MLLAKEGFDVTVFEKNSRENLGHDWTDAFDRKVFEIIGIPMPDESLYYLKHDITFYSPGQRTSLKQSIPKEQLEINMDRKDLYNHIIPYAEKAGVKFVYNCNIEGPVLDNEKIRGIKTDKGTFTGDLVIDACGVNSPIRKNLPESLGIQKQVGEYEQFYSYRAFYNKSVASQFTHMGSGIAKACVVSALMPAKYNKKQVLRWVNRYNNCFKPVKN